MSQDQFFAQEQSGPKESALGLLAGLGLMTIALLTIVSAVLLLYAENPGGFSISQAPTSTAATASPRVVTATPSATVGDAGQPTQAPAPTATWGWPTTTIIWPTAVPWPPTQAVSTRWPCSPPPPPYWTYTVQRGDTLSGLAARYGTSVGVLMQINCLTSSQIYVGQRLYIPGYPPRTPIVPTSTTGWPTATPSLTAGTPTLTPETPSPTGELPTATPETPSPTAGTPTLTPETPSPTGEPPTATPETPAPTTEPPTATPETPAPTVEPTAPATTQPPPTEPPTEPAPTATP